MARNILHFDDINQCHEAMGFVGRTNLPGFHAYTVEETYPSTRSVMPPYTLRFYCVTLLESSDDAVLTLNNARPAQLSDTVAFQSPGHVAAWVRGQMQRGYILYFQPEFLSHHRAALLEDFPFFSPTEMNVLSLRPEEKSDLADHCVRMLRMFNSQHPYREAMLQAMLVAFLFDCRCVHERYRAEQAKQPMKSALATRFQQALEQHFLTRQTVQAYADLLAVTPNHLSQAVSATLGRTAHALISDRLLIEAKKLLRHTDLPVNEVADYLGFDEPTHFGRFFKRHTSLTPLNFRQQFALPMRAS